MFCFLLKKQAWNWCSCWPLLNIQRLLLQSFACLDAVGEFRILCLFSHINQRSPNSRTKFVPFSPLSKHEIIIMFILYWENRSLSLRRNVVILSSDFLCLHNPRSSYWSSTTFLLHQNNTEPIKIHMNASECFLSPSAQSFESGVLMRCF